VSQSAPGRKPRKRLAPSEKYEIFIQVLTQQATQLEAADRWGVDRSTVVSVCRTAKQGALDALAAAKPGRPGRSREQIELDEAREEIERLRATVTEQAVSLHLYQGKSRWDCCATRRSVVSPIGVGRNSEGIPGPDALPAAER
jgi:transposase-like protein